MNRTSNRNRKRALVGLGAAVVVAGAAVAATLSVTGTGAVLTDTQTATSNAFSAGTLDVTLTADGSAALAPINITKMAPGDYVYKAIDITNQGSLAARYSVTSTSTALSTAVSGQQDGVQLAKDLVATVKTGLTAAQCNAETGAGDATWTAGSSTNLPSTAGDLAAATPAVGSPVKFIGDATQGQQTGDRTLGAGSGEALCMQVTLPKTAGNADQGASATFSLAFNAEQTLNN